MLPDPLPLTLALLLGGVVAVDGTSFGQFMLSRPLVAATLAGAAMGNPIQGAVLGMILEAFHLGVLPVGAARYPEGGPAAVAGSVTYATLPAAPGTLLLTVLAVLFFEWIGGETVRYLRQANTKLIPVGPGSLLDARGLERRHLAAIGLDFLRGVMLVAVGALTIGGFVSLTSEHWGLSDAWTRLALLATVAAMLASAVRIVGGRVRLAAGGALLTLLLLYLVR